MTFGTPVSEKEAVALTWWAIEHGINFIDTANIYEGYSRYVGSPGGVAEMILGKALKGQRERAIVASKVGMQVGPEAEDTGLSRKHIQHQIDRSLARLRCDYLDLYYMHRPDPETPVTESIQAFDELIQAGKIRYWGVSNFTAEQLGELLQTCEENGFSRPVACQPAYSLLKREVERDLLPLCHHERIAVVPYQVLQGGLLTAKYHRDVTPPPGSRKEEKPDWVWELTGELFDQLESFEAQARVQNRTLMAHAIQTVLAHPAVISVIVGVKRIEQLQALIDIVT
jgi:aryl-alcohol dehydrogenase-like predicted oxidoreductase